MNFYSEQEIKKMNTAIKTGEKLVNVARILSKEFNRSEASVYVKLLSLSGRTGRKKSKIKKVEKVKTNSGIVLNKGFVFDFKPQRAEMHSDHVRLYF